MKLKTLGLAALLGLTACAGFTPKPVSYGDLGTAPYNEMLCTDGEYDWNAGCIEDVKNLENMTTTVFEIRTNYNHKGTGFLLDGYFITANHVIDFDNIKGYINYEGETYEIDVLKRDYNLDILIGKVGINVKESYRAGKDVKVGNEVIVAGNRKNKGIQVRRGKISVLDRETLFVDKPRLTISKAGIDFGDSGCPVFAIKDGELEVIGVTVSKIDDADGMGNLAKIEYIKQMMEELK
ncbi:MAG: serine protease [archaeon]